MPFLYHEIYIKQIYIKLKRIFQISKIIESKKKIKKNLPRRTSAGMSLLNVLGRSSSFFSSAAKTIAMTNNRIGANFIILKMTRERKREKERGKREQTQRTSKEEKEKKKGSSYTD